MHKACMCCQRAKAAGGICLENDAFNVTEADGAFCLNDFTGKTGQEHRKEPWSDHGSKAAGRSNE